MQVLKSPTAIIGIFIAYSLLTLYLPNFNLTEQAELFLSTLIVFFSIVAGFTIAATWSEYSIIREAVTNEISHIMNTYAIVKNFKKVRRRFVEELDKYLIAVLVVQFRNFSKTDKIFDSLRDNLLKEIRPKGQKETSLFEKLTETLEMWESSRESQIVLGPSRVPKSLWLLLIVLAFGTISYLYLIKTSSLTSMMATTLVAFAITLTLIVVKDLDEYQFGEFPAFTESTEQIFEYIGKPRFYWEKDVKRGEVKPPTGLKNYRTKLSKELEGILFDGGVN